jgi:hypothetical protein
MTAHDLAAEMAAMKTHQLSIRSSAGLLKRLPKTGDVWPEADRKLWLQLLEGSFKLI